MLDNISTDASLASYNLSYLKDPSFGGWRLAEDTCRFLGILCRTFRPRSVIEFGSGLSTMILAEEIKQGNVGNVLSIDHNDRFPGYPRSLLSGHPAKSNICLSVSPLGLAAYARKLFAFYVLDKNTLKSNAPYDLVIIDGPPYTFDSREAALYAVWPYLAVGGMVILDDANRKDKEQVYLRNWKYHFGESLACRIPDRPFQKGIAILWKTEANHPVKAFSIFESLRSAFKAISILRGGLRNFIKRGLSRTS